MQTIAEHLTALWKGKLFVPEHENLVTGIISEVNVDCSSQEEWLRIVLEGGHEYTIVDLGAERFTIGSAVAPPGVAALAMDCDHPNAFLNCQFWRHTKGDNGPVVAYTAHLALNCVACGVAFHFGTNIKRVGMTLQVGVAPGEPLPESDFVPGAFRCPVCLFRLQTNKLYADTGAIAMDRDAKPEPCPNDGTMMEQVSWRELHAEASDIYERLWKRCRQLEDAWPEAYAMPVEEGSDQDG